MSVLRASEIRKEKVIDVGTGSGKVVAMPSVRERMARLILAGTLAASVGAAAVVSSPNQALAAEPETGKITINAVTGNQVTYNAYKIFSADVTDAGKAQHVEWASNEAKAAVEGVLKTANTSPAYTGTTAQDALEYLNANWGASSFTRIVGATDLPNRIADAVDAIEPAGTVTPGTAATFDEGYYLFVTTPSTLGVGEMGTSAIFTGINKAVPVTVTEKTSLPTVDKTVKEDSGGKEATPDTYVESEPVAPGQSVDGLYVKNGTEYEPAAGEAVAGVTYYVKNAGSPAVSEWGKHADANVGQVVEYKLEGTVAKNVESFDTYFYEFEDNMTGIELTSLDDVVVKIDGVTVASGYTKTFANGKLLVTFEDLLSAKATANDTESIPITDATKVVVEYKAKLTNAAVIGSAGNPNTVKITYNNNPNNTSKGSTVEVQNKLFCYELELVKVDKDNATKVLPGAKITIQVASTNSDEGSRGKYLQADGTLGTTAYQFTTDAQGKINVPRIDEGTYILHEVTPPSNYAAWDADITLTIASVFDAQGALTGISGTLSGGEGDANTKVLTTDTASGKVAIQATDDKELDMPLTGEQGTMLLTALGIGIVGISLAGLYRNRRKTEES